MSSDVRPVILTFVRYYLPGYRSGGPIRTVANLVDQLGGEFDFRIVTSDRDALDTRSYPNVKVDEWNNVGRAKVLYTTERGRSFRRLVQLFRDLPHDAIYLNSLFDPVYTFRPLVINRLAGSHGSATILAPRGELSRGALALKSLKKSVYLRTVRFSGLFSDVYWHASSEHELADIQRVLGAAPDVYVASNLAQPLVNATSEAGTPCPGDPLKVVFLSRITPMKNLDFALRVLSKVGCPVEFNIFGPIRDEEYWRACEQLIGRMPSHISVKYNGTVTPAHVHDVLAAHDLFLLPTRGENYGHVIAEAFCAGTPALIADTTPWRGLETFGAGWDLPLDDESRFVDRVELCARSKASGTPVNRRSIRSFADRRLNDPELIRANRRLFTAATRRSIEQNCERERQ